jgi:hypothetical protein
VIPFEEPVELVRAGEFQESALVEVGADHRLADSAPMEALARAVEAR